MLFEKSNDTKIIESLLSEAKVGDQITYEALSKAIGRDVRQHARQAMRSARSTLLNQGVVFGVEAGVGLTRLNDVAIVESSESDRLRMRRASNRALKKLSVVAFDNLPEEKKRQHVVASAQFGAMQLFSSASTRKKIESKVDSGSKQMPIGETLKLFS